FRLPPVRQQPPGALRQKAAEKEDHDAERRADRESEAPAEIGRQKPGIEKHDRAERAESRAHPEAAVDREVGSPAVPRRDQLLDRGVDRRVLAADPRPGEEAEEEEAPEVPGEGG